MKNWYVTRLYLSNESHHLKFATLAMAQRYWRRASDMGWTVSTPWQKVTK